MNTYRSQLQQLIDTRRALEDTVTYKFSAEEVEGLRTKLRHLHDTLRGGQSRGRAKERQLVSFHDLIESIEEAEAEVCSTLCWLVILCFCVYFLFLFGSYFLCWFVYLCMFFFKWGVTKYHHDHRLIGCVKKA